MSESSDVSDDSALVWITDFDNRGGPPCEQCGLLASVHRSETKGLMCARCLQSDFIQQLVGFWGKLHRTHRILSDATIAYNIAEHLWGDGLEGYCYCGNCNPKWFLRGWISWTKSAPSRKLCNIM